MANAKKRPIAVLRIGVLRKLGDFILKIRSIIFDIGANPTYFATPSPALATVGTHIDDLEDAEDLAEAKTTGAVQARDLKYDIVRDDANALMMYVQGLADAAPDRETAIAIITASGFEVKGFTSHSREELTVVNTDISGKVMLTSKSAGKRGAHEWNYSTDNGVTWSYLPATLQAKTFAEDFTPGSKVSFRHRAVTKAADQGWSQIFTLLVT